MFLPEGHRNRVRNGQSAKQHKSQSRTHIEGGLVLAAALRISDDCAQLRDKNSKCWSCADRNDCTMQAHTTDALHWYIVERGTSGTNLRLLNAGLKLRSTVAIERHEELKLHCESRKLDQWMTGFTLDASCVAFRNQVRGAVS